MFKFDFLPALFLLITVPVIVLFYFRKSGRAGVRFSSVKNAARVKKSLRQQLMILPLILRIIAVVLIIFALARPQMGSERVKDVSRGVAIEMVVDRSGSMGYMKDFGSKAMTRLEVVKQVFKEFISGKGGVLKGRPNDLIGMISFARYADTLCPLTLSHGALLRFIDSLQIVSIDSENATSIGDAVALAAARLKTAESSLETGSDEEAEYEIKSKVIILLTDGEDTGVGKRTPLEAAELAKEWGIKIYTVGLSGSGWYVIQEDPFFGRRKREVPSSIDSALLERMAKETGGIFRTAGDIQSLQDVYKEIDELEKSEITSERYLDYKEFFVPLVVLGLLFLLAEFTLNATLFRRIP